MTLYLQEIGVPDRSTAAAWAGAVNGLSFVIFATANVVWGGLSDRWGLKAGIVRCLGLSTVALGICAIAQDPVQLLLGRLLQAIGGGPNAASTALASTILPPNQLSLGMGVLQTGLAVGLAIGPAIGGVIGATWSFRVAYVLAAVFAGAMLLLVIVLVPEPRRQPRPPGAQGFLAGCRVVLSHPTLRHVFVVLAFMQAAYQSVWTYVPLRVQEIVTDPAQVPQWAGLSMMGDALGLAVGSTLLGLIAGRWGSKRVIIAATSIAVVLSVLQVWLLQPIPLIVARFFIGLLMGGAVPIMRTLLTLYTAPGYTGIAFGLIGGIYAGASGVGTIVGAVVIATVGMEYDFLVSAALAVASVVWAFLYIPAESTPRT